MSKRIIILSTVGGIALLCIAVIFYLKPDVHEVPIDGAMSWTQREQVPIVTTTQPPETVAKDLQVDVSEAELIEQRDALYVTFGQISMDMMEGQKPDLRQVSQMLEQHQSLMKQGIILPDDAKTYLEFLQKIFPEMHSELNFYLQEIERIKA